MLKKSLKKIITIASALCVTALCTINALANEVANEVVGADSFNPVLDALRAQISVSSIMSVLVVVVGASVGLAFMWWGVRKVTGALMAAFKKGKVKL